MDNFYDEDIDKKNKESRLETKRRKTREVNDLLVVMKTPEGRRLLWRIWSECGIFSNPFNLNSNQAAFNSGMMSIGQKLLVDVNEADTFAFAKIQQEYVSELKSKKQLKEENE